ARARRSRPGHPAAGARRARRGAGDGQPSACTRSLADTPRGVERGEDMVLTTSTEPTTGDTPETAVSSVAFGIDELAALATLLGASRFPGVPEALFTALTPQARDAAQRAARRGLVARGVIGFAPD